MLNIWSLFGIFDFLFQKMLGMVQTSYLGVKFIARNMKKKFVPNLNPFWGQPAQLDPFLDPEGQPYPFEPENWAQNWVESNKTGQIWPH